MAFLVSEIVKRDEELARLKCEQMSDSTDE